MEVSSHETDVPEGRSKRNEQPSLLAERLGKRIIFTAFGGLLVLVGIKRGSLGGIVTALVGSGLVYRGFRARHSRQQNRSDEMGETHAVDSHGESVSGLSSQRTITIRKSEDELYERWQEPQTINRIMGHVADVAPAAGDRQRWIVGGPLNTNVQWETETVANRPGELLRWESLEDAPVSTGGEVRFRSAPGDRGTEVTLELYVDPPGNTLGNTLLKRLDILPESVAKKSLHRFKSLAETGEIPTLEHNPSARGSGDLL